MRMLAEAVFAWLSEWCRDTQQYRFYGKQIICSVDWEKVTKEVHSIAESTRALKGGFLPDVWYGVDMPSWAFKGDQADYIIVYPGNWRKKMYAAFGKRVRREDIDPHQVLGIILAHEVRHIMQGRRKSSFKINALLAGMYAAPVGAIIALIMCLLGLTPWWMPIFLCLTGMMAFWGYFIDPREVDARLYARENWQKWAKYISIAPI